METFKKRTPPHLLFSKIVIKKMATYKNKTSSISKSYSPLTCDICNSVNIQETIEGYVCGDCGIVLEIQKLQYHRLYNDDILQYAVLGTTQIGTKRERQKSPNSIKLEHLNFLHSIKCNFKSVQEKVRIETRRIFNCLNLPSSCQSIVFKRVKDIWKQFRPGTKYRQIEKLVPIVLYYTLRLENICIRRLKLLEVSKISKKEFNDFSLQVLKFIPEYQERNRQDYIVQKIMEITETFELGMPFFYQSKKIIHKLWEQIKNTKDDVVAGLTTAISVLCSYKDVVKVSSICKMLGIKMSTIQFQVKKRIFEQLQVEGFTSLVRSSDLLKEVMLNLGLLETKERVKDTQNDIVQIVLGNANQVFNHQNGIDYYFFAMRDVQNNPILMMVKIYLPLMNFESLKRPEGQRRELFDFEHLTFYKNKDPPLCEA